jgi:hypothetical protein
VSAAGWKALLGGIAGIAVPAVGTAVGAVAGGISVALSMWCQPQLGSELSHNVNLGFTTEANQRRICCLEGGG